MVLSSNQSLMTHKRPAELIVCRNAKDRHAIRDPRMCLYAEVCDWSQRVFLPPMNSHISSHEGSLRRRIHCRPALVVLDALAGRVSEELVLGERAHCARDAKRGKTLGP